jgi:hypothetical protein
MRKLTRGALAVPPLALTLMLTLTMALTGCGSASGGSQVASAAGAGGGGTGGGGGSATPGLSRDEMGVKFAQCMRENGVDMPDPEPGRGVQLRVGPGTSRETVDAAMEACREYNPQANGSAGADPQAEERTRKFAECMRSNGVESFPDPEPGQRGIMIDGTTGDDPDFATAQQKCQDVLSGGTAAGGQ